ncbi:MAG TPA: universal stress protein [Micromonosporaceae bacterium]|nr:universal stress protein [Micromonosporaceae bacterium]
MPERIPREPQRIIVGFDGSEHAVAALTWAIAEARLRDARVVALAVFDEAPQMPKPQSLKPPPDVLGDLRAAVRAVAQDFPAIFRYGVGSPAATIVNECTASDLLVVGSRGRNPFAGLLLGSVSRACLALAPCPVVVVRPSAVQRRPYGRIVTGVDASEPAQRGLRVAAEETRLRGGVLRVIHVLPDSHGLQLAVAAGARPEALADEVRGDGALPANVADLEVPVESVVVGGHPGDVLVRESEEADLLVLGSRGTSAVAGLLLGSTSDYCARHAACPVMIVRSAGEEP